MTKLNAWLATLLLAAAAPAHADALPEPLTGYLCCNMRSDGSWISDANYLDGRRVIPLGTPVKALDLGRYRVNVQVAGARQSIGNDYSRDLDMMTFAKRYIVAQDPKEKIATFPPAFQKAIRTARVSVGMSREQVLMALGYPITSENARLDAPTWRYWAAMDQEYQVHFDAQGLVKEIAADESFRHFVVME